MKIIMQIDFDNSDPEDDLQNILNDGGMMDELASEIEYKLWELMDLNQYARPRVRLSFATHPR